MAGKLYRWQRSTGGPMLSYCRKISVFNFLGLFVLDIYTHLHPFSLNNRSVTAVPVILAQ